METLYTIRKVIADTIEQKLAEVLSTELKFPLPLVDYLGVRGKKLKILLEIYEDTVIAYLAQDRDIFAEGPTIRKAKTNLRASLNEEYAFFLRHEKELSKDLKNKLTVLQRLLE